MISMIRVFHTVMLLAVSLRMSFAFYATKNFECGPYGFVCQSNDRLRLCEGDSLKGPAFICPDNTVCNEDSNDVCENTINYIDPIITRNLNCRRNERVADPTVPNCKGYILCIPNKNRFQGIKFKCSGNTIFNGYTRTCSAPNKYKCPVTNTTKAQSNYFERHSHHHNNGNQNTAIGTGRNRAIDCKNYKLRLTEDSSPVRATYFCPSHPVRTGDPIKCTVFSNQYCLTLERDDEDQFIQETGAAYRRPRKN